MQILKIIGLAVAGFIGMLLFVTILFAAFSKKEPKVKKKPVRVSSNIEVRSIAVRESGDQFRYTFLVENNDTVDFKGKVKILLRHDNGSKAEERTFVTEIPMKANESKAVFIDTNIRPLSTGGTSFTYDVLVRDHTTQSEYGTINIHEN